MSRASSSATQCALSCYLGPTNSVDSYNTKPCEQMLSESHVTQQVRGVNNHCAAQFVKMMTGALFSGSRSIPFSGGSLVGSHCPRRSTCRSTFTVRGE